jgi:hypothetical protein
MYFEGLFGFFRPVKLLTSTADLQPGLQASDQNCRPTSSAGVQPVLLASDQY